MSGAIANIIKAAKTTATAAAVRITMALVDFTAELVQVQTLGEDDMPGAEMDHYYQLCGFRHVPVEGAEGIAVYLNGANDRVIVAAEYLAIDLSAVVKGATKVFGAPSGLGLLILADGSAQFDGPMIRLGPAAAAPVARVGDTVTVTVDGKTGSGTITSGAANVLA